MLQISEEGNTEGGGVMKALVGTQFVEWSARYFAQPELRKRPGEATSETECDLEWR